MSRGIGIFAREVIKMKLQVKVLLECLKNHQSLCQLTMTKGDEQEEEEGTI